MAGLSSISVDSLGNRNSYGLPPLTNNPGTPADREVMARWVEVQRRDPPGQWTDDRQMQARSFVNGGYIAVNAIMTAVGGSHAVVLQRQAPRVTAKSLSSATSSDESEWSPVEPDHEIAKLFACPNGPDFPDGQTFSEWLAEYVMCDRLFGLAAVMWNKGKGTGKPVEMWNLRPNYLMSAAGLDQYHPRGSWRYYLPRPMLWGVSGNLVIPRERMVIQKRPHPLFPWDGYSPFQAGSKLVDFLNGVIDSRQKAMDGGLTIQAVINMVGATPDQLKTLDAAIREKYTRSNSGQQFAVMNGDAISVNPLSTTPDKMGYEESYKHGVEAVLALLGVPKECAFMAEGGSYSQFYASARAWRDMGLNSLVKGIAERLTMSFIRPHWGDQYKLDIKLPPLMDPEQKERQWNLLNSASGVAYRLKELRSAFDMPRMEGDELTPDEAKAELAKKSQPQQAMGGGLGLPQPQPFGGDELSQLLGGGNAEPFAPGEMDTPDVGSASEGSLPGKVAKSRHTSADLSAYFGRLVEEVCAS